MLEKTLMYVLKSSLFIFAENKHASMSLGMTSQAGGRGWGFHASSGTYQRVIHL